MTKIDMNVADDRVWAYTLALLDSAKADTKSRTTKIVCKNDSCGRALGLLVATANGAGLLVTSWDAGAFEPQSMAAMVQEFNPVESGRPFGSVRHRCGALVALEVPATLAQQYPPLYVRCSRHGDVVLNRDEAIGRNGGGKRVWAVVVSLPFADVIDQRIDGLERERTSSSRTFQIGSPASAIPIHEFNDWWKNAAP